MKVVILGIGNRLMEDDGVGNDIVEELKRKEAFPGLRMLAGETDTEYCLKELEGADTAILIDAANMGNEPCSVSVLPLGNILEKRALPRFSHHHDLLHGMKLQNYQGDGILVAVEVCSVQHRFGLSPQMREQFPRIVDEIKQLIESYLNL